MLECTDNKQLSAFFAGGRPVFLAFSHSLSLAEGAVRKSIDHSAGKTQPRRPSADNSAEKCKLAGLSGIGKTGKPEV